jgi:parallel beta-helix repeat protein
MKRPRWKRHWATRGLGACLAATALSFAFGWSATIANAAHVSCGETITTDTTLDSDLTKCAGAGIRIGADDITLDLNGHTTTGKGKGSGVDNTAGHDGVTIEGGSIRNFAESVAIVGASDNLLRGLSLSDHRHVGIYVQDSSAIQIEHSSVVDTRFTGIFLLRSRDIRVEESFSSRNGWSGIVAQASHHIAIEGNLVQDNSGWGIVLQETSESHVVANTTSNSEAGVALDAADANQVSNNLVSHNGDGIIVLGSANTITDNQVAHASGCKKGCGYGISLDGGAGNLIAQNEVEGTMRDGIRIDAFLPEMATVDNVVSGNLISAANVDGFSIGTEGDGTVSGTLIEGNFAIGSGDDGFDLRRAAATLTSNTANDNHDLGIEAMPGVIDGGGNKASGNGNPLQCTTVFCN